MPHCMGPSLVKRVKKLKIFYIDTFEHVLHYVILKLVKILTKLKRLYTHVFGQMPHQRLKLMKIIIEKTERTLRRRLESSTLLCETKTGQKSERTERTLNWRLWTSIILYYVRLKPVKILKKLKGFQINSSEQISRRERQKLVKILRKLKVLTGKVSTWGLLLYYVRPRLVKRVRKLEGLYIGTYGQLWILYYVRLKLIKLKE